MLTAKEIDGELWVRAADMASATTYTSYEWDKAQAAIALKVPCSGIPELDAMIRESRRLDMATAAMQSQIVGVCGIDHTDRAIGEVVALAHASADALLAASGKGKP